jgi:hypothetical protein
MWQQLLCNKYLKNKTLAQVEVKPTDSPFWKGLMHVKEDFFKRGVLEWGMEHLLGSGRMCGWAILLYLINMPHFIILFSVRMC